MPASGEKDITQWAAKDGEFKRQVSSFRNHIEPNGRFPPEKGEYSGVGVVCAWIHSRPLPATLAVYLLAIQAATLTGIQP